MTLLLVHYLAVKSKNVVRLFRKIVRSMPRETNIHYFTVSTLRQKFVEPATISIVTSIRY